MFHALCFGGVGCVHEEEEDEAGTFPTAWNAPGVSHQRCTSGAFAARLEQVVAALRRKSVAITGHTPRTCPYCFVALTNTCLFIDGRDESWCS